MSLISNNNNTTPIQILCTGNAPFSFDGAILSLAKDFFAEMQQREAQLKAAQNLNENHSVVPHTSSLMKMVHSLAHILSGEFHKELPERELLRKIRQLSVLLEKVDRHNDLKEAREFWKTMDPELFSLLCRGVWYAHKGGEWRFGERCIESNPHILLQAVTADGENLIKKLISELESIGQKKIDPSLLHNGHLSGEKLQCEIEERMKGWGPSMKVISLPDSYTRLNSLGIDLTLSYLLTFFFNRLGETIQDLGLSIEERTQLVHSFFGRGEAGFSYIDHFQLPQEEHINIVSKLIERNDYYIVANNLTKFDLSQEALTRFTHLCFQNDPESLARNLQKFTLSQEEHIALLYVLMERNAFHPLVYNIHKFTVPSFVLDDVTSRCIKGDPSLIVYKITRLPWLTVQQRTDLAYHLLNQSLYSLSREIKKLDLPEQVRFELALHYVTTQNNYYQFGYYFKNFELSPEHQTQIVFTVAKKAPRDLPDNISSFQGLSDESRYELAVIFCNRWGDYYFSIFSPYKSEIDKFNLIAPDFMKILVLFSEKYPSKIPEIFKEKLALSEENRYQLASLYSFYDPRDAAQKISLFNLSEEHRRECAFNCAKKPSALAESIHLFNISEEKIRIELVRTCFKHCHIYFNTKSLVNQFENFKIEDLDSLTAIAEDFLLQDPEALLTFSALRNLPTLELIKKSAKLSPVILATLIEKGYTAIIKTNGVELVKICAASCEERDIPTVFSLIQNIRKITNIEHSELLELYKLCFRRNVNFLSTDLLYLDEPNEGYIDVIQAYLESALPKMGFEDNLQYICKIPDLHLQKQQLKWLAYSLSVFRANLSDQQLLWIRKCRFIDTISQTPLPDLRPIFTDVLVEVAVNPYPLPTTSIAKKQPNEKLLEDRKNLLSLFFHSFRQQGISEKTLEMLQEQVITRYFIQNTLHFRSVILAFYKLIKEIDLSSAEKDHVLTQLCTQSIVKIQSKKGKEKYHKDNELMLLSLSSLTTILEFKEIDVLKSISQPFPILLEKMFKKHVPIKDIPDFVSKFHATFGSARYPEGLITFAGRMKENGSAFLQSLADYTCAVLTGDFPASRYRLENNPHLQAIKPEVLHKWTQTLNPVQLKFGQNEGKQIVAFDWLKNCFYHDHLLPNENYPHLLIFLLKPAEENRQKLLAQIAEKLKLTPDDQQLQIEQECLLLIDSNNNNLSGNLSRLQGLLKDSGQEFLNDVNGYLDSLKPKKSVDEDLIAIDTDDPYTIFNSGKDVGGSCQRWDGHPSLCCGLLGYLQHGQTRLLAIVNQEGKIHSRAIFRLLLDPKNNPVLFIEKVYPQNASQSQIKALFQLAKAKAAQMGLPLTASQWETKNKPKPYPSSLYSLGGPAPAEYCDAAVGEHVCPNGKFEIANAFYFDEIK